MRPCARTASLHQPTRLDLQPHEPWARHVGVSPALRWLCAYLFMLNGTVYVAGLVRGGGWRSLLPRRTDLFDALTMLDTTSAFPSLNWRAANGCIPFSTQSTTRSSAQHTSLFQSLGCFRLVQAGRFTSPCSSIGWQRSLGDTTQRVSGISG
jgi:hypothetical protein